MLNYLHLNRNPIKKHNLPIHYLQINVMTYKKLNNHKTNRLYLAYNRNNGSFYINWRSVKNYIHSNFTSLFISLVECLWEWWNECLSIVYGNDEMNVYPLSMGMMEWTSLFSKRSGEYPEFIRGEYCQRCSFRDGTRSSRRLN